jgi:N-acetylated-alpha-linked acidic dipeptidase
LVGSTEWGEDFTDWIREHVVAYINIGMFPYFSDKMTCILLSYSDTSVSGSHLKASASPLLAHLLRSTAEQIPHPTSEGRSLWDARLDKGELFGESLDAEATAIYEEMESTADNIGINPLGSGSDYTVFLQYIGVRNTQEIVEFDLISIQVASSEAGFSSTLHDPVYHYHSVFDSQHWQEVYGDPSFSRHVCFRVTARLRRS